MQATTTRVDAVVTGLLAAWRTAMPTVSILDGPRAAQGLKREVLQVGVGNDENANAYESETELQEGLGARLAETITVHCDLSTWSGNAAAEMGPLRTRLTALLAAIDTGFRADQRLGGACDRIHLGPRARWYPLQSEDGAGMGIEFSVVAQAWL